MAENFNEFDVSDEAHVVFDDDTGEPIVPTGARDLAELVLDIGNVRNHEFVDVERTSVLRDGDTVLVKVKLTTGLPLEATIPRKQLRQLLGREDI